MNIVIIGIGILTIIYGAGSEIEKEQQVRKGVVKGERTHIVTRPVGTTGSCFVERTYYMEDGSWSAEKFIPYIDSEGKPNLRRDRYDEGCS